MLRRTSALIGMALLVALLIALVWAVHQHRERMPVAPDSEELISAAALADPAA